MGIPLICLFVAALADSHASLLPKGPGIWRLVLVVLGLVSGLITAGVGFYLNRDPSFWTIDPTTGLQYFDKSARHSLYFVPMQYWGLFYCALALAGAAVYR